MDSCLPLSEVVLRWGPGGVSSKFDAAVLQPDIDRTHAIVVKLLILSIQIIEPLRLIGGFVSLDVACGVNAISGGGKDEHAPGSLLLRICLEWTTFAWAIGNISKYN